MAFVVGGGDLPWLRALLVLSPFARPSTVSCVDEEVQRRRPPATSEGMVLKILMIPLLSFARPALWSPVFTRFVSLSSPKLRCSGCGRTTPHRHGFRPWLVQRRNPSVGESLRGWFGVVSGEASVASGRMDWMGFGVFQFGWAAGLGRSSGELETIKPTRTAKVFCCFPELVPVVDCSCIPTGVGSSFVVVVTVVWAAGVGSGLVISMLYVSTGLLLGLSLWCYVSGTVERFVRSVEFGFHPRPIGIGLYGPSGIIKMLTVLVSGPSTGGSSVCGGTLVLLWSRSNLRRALQVVLLVTMLDISVSVVVFMTLIT